MRCRYTGIGPPIGRPSRTRPRPRRRRNCRRSGCRRRRRRSTAAGAGSLTRGLDLPQVDAVVGDLELVEPDRAERRRTGTEKQSARRAGGRGDAAERDRARRRWRRRSARAARRRSSPSPRPTTAGGPGQPRDLEAVELHARADLEAGELLADGVHRTRRANSSTDVPAAFIETVARRRRRVGGAATTRLPAPRRDRDAVDGRTRLATTSCRRRVAQALALAVSAPDLTCCLALGRLDPDGEAVRPPCAPWSSVTRTRTRLAVVARRTAAGRGRRRRARRRGRAGARARRCRRRRCPTGSDDLAVARPGRRDALSTGSPGTRGTARTVEPTGG